MLSNDFPTLESYQLADVDGWEWHDTYSITLGELIEDGIFAWNDIEIGNTTAKLDWSDAAYSPEVYSRLCEGFNVKYWDCEIAVTPPGLWMVRLGYKLNYDVAPRYKWLYELYGNLPETFEDWKTKSNKYGKKRDLMSKFPETLLSANSDYATAATDNEYEDIEDIGELELFERLKNVDFKSLDNEFLSEFESMFSPLFSENLNLF